MEELHSIVKHEATSQPVHPDPRAEDKKLRLHGNMTYIVVGVAFDGDKVLMIQEAKASCRGSWYLPAGRMEPNETIVEGVKREVLEESGLIFEPEAVIVVECTGHAWTRITLIGRVAGGRLKTTAEADSESLQAGWYSQQELERIDLRAPDILPLIEAGRGWKRRERKYGGLPVLLGHVSSSLRLVVVASDRGEVKVLVRSGESPGSTSFPVLDTYNYKRNLTNYMKTCGYKGDYSIKGVLSLEHMGRPHGERDGMCLSVLLEAKSAGLEGGRGYEWCSLRQDLVEPVKHALAGNCAELAH